MLTSKASVMTCDDLATRVAFEAYTSNYVYCSTPFSPSKFSSGSLRLRCQQFGFGPNRPAAPQLKQAGSPGCANTSYWRISCHLDTPVDRLAGLHFSTLLRVSHVSAFSIQICWRAFARAGPFCGRRK